jgi:hypothetical protein
MGPPNSSPPGFEGLPLYRQNTPIYNNTMIKKKTQKTDTYTSIKTLCAEKLNIYLPSIGYCHIVLEDEHPDSLFEIAYKNEFHSKKKPEYPAS